MLLYLKILKLGAIVICNVQMRKVMFFEVLLVYIGPGKNIRGSLEKSELAKYIHRLGSVYALSFTVGLQPRERCRGVVLRR